MGNRDVMHEIYHLLAYPTSKKLGEIISEKIRETGLPDYQIAQILGIPKTTFARLIGAIEAGNIQKMDFYDVLKMCQFLGLGIEEISQFYVASLQPEHVGELERARVASFLVQNFDLKGLKEIGFIDSVTDIPAIQQRITTYFNLDSIFQYKGQLAMVMYSRQRKSFQG